MGTHYQTAADLEARSRRALAGYRKTASITTLRALSSSELVTDNPIYVTGTQDVYLWDSTSTDPDDGSAVIKPDDVAGAGRWLLQTVFTQNQGGLPSLKDEASPALQAPADQIKESGGTTLALGAVADGEYLQRSGSAFVGATPGGGPPSGAAGGDLSGTYPNPGVAKVSGTTPGAFGLTLLDDATQAAGRTTLGLGTAALVNTGAGTGDVPLNSDLGSASLVNTGVGTGDVPLNSDLGSASLLTAGTGANNAVQLDGSAKLPAVDGSLLTNLPAGGLPFGLVESTPIDYDADVDGSPTSNGMTCSGTCTANGIYYDTANGTIAYDSAKTDLTMGLYFRFKGIIGGYGLPCRFEVYTGQRRIDFYVTSGGSIWTVTPVTKIHAGGSSFPSTNHIVELYVPPGSAHAWWAVDGVAPSETGGRRQALSSFTSATTQYGFKAGWFTSSGTAFQVEEFEFRVVTP